MHCSGLHTAGKVLLSWRGNYVIKLQKSCARMLPGLEVLSYEERSDRLDLISLEQRKLRGDKRAHVKS